jgi:serine/threonine-protein kinase
MFPLYGTSPVNSTGASKLILPPQTRMSDDALSGVGWFPGSTVEAPVTHGAGVTGMRGMGVSTPKAAAVAEAAHNHRFHANLAVASLSARCRLAVPYSNQLYGATGLQPVSPHDVTAPAARFHLGKTGSGRSPLHIPPLDTSSRPMEYASAKLLSMAFAVGDNVGDYQVVGLLGAGGMGTVYKVRNALTDRVEAMKVLLPNLESSPDLAERFSREIKMHASLSHPNIAALHTAIRVDHQLIMIMEMVEGQSIRERLKQGPMELRESVNCACQVLSALSYAHECGVVHRDIKPANIMLTPDRRVKVMDFGIALVKGTDRRLTMTGMAVGSLHYMSPEQVRSAPPDARSDIYSIGATLYEMVTGHCPIEGDSEFSIMNGHLSVVPRAPVSLNPFLPPDLSAVILRALEKRPEDRFQSAHEFRMALEAVAGQRPGLAAFPPADRPAPAPHAATVTPTGAATAPSAWDPAVLAKAAKDLAVYIGPLAKVLVNRAAKHSHNLRQLYETVAAEIPTAADRETFLRKIL